MKSHSYPGPEVTGFALRGSRIKRADCCLPNLE